VPLRLNALLQNKVICLGTQPFVRGASRTSSFRRQPTPRTVKRIQVAITVRSCRQCDRACVRKCVPKGRCSDLGCEDLCSGEDLCVLDLCCEDLSHSLTRWSTPRRVINDPCAAALQDVSRASAFHHLAACVSRCLPPARAGSVPLAIRGHSVK